jgi:fermentation-respiration switch protein FrsA (DUF1100 family)
MGLWTTKIPVWGMALALLATGAGCANGLFYQPTHRIYQTPADRQLPYEPVTMVSADGTRLSGWFIPAVGVATGTVVHLHGNAQNMTAHFGFVDWLPAQGFNVFVFDYRGYGASEGRPRRGAVIEDCRAALRYVWGRADVDPNRVVVYGQSLGGASAVAALVREPGLVPRAIVLDSAFASYRGIVRDKIAMIPLLRGLRWPLSYLVVSGGYSPDAEIARLPRVPLLLVHGVADRVVPAAHSVRLFERAHAPKSLWLVPGCDHTEAFMRKAPEYRPRLVAYLRAALNGTASEPVGVLLD